MTVDDIVFLGRDALFITLLVASPMLIAGLIVGLVISIFQSVTQVQEITLTFIPKIIAVFVAFVIFMPWMISLAMDFIQPLFNNLDTMVK